MQYLRRYYSQGMKHTQNRGISIHSINFRSPLLLHLQLPFSRGPRSRSHSNLTSEEVGTQFSWSSSRDIWRLWGSLMKQNGN